MSYPIKSNQILPGDIFKDKRGEHVTVKSVSHNRICFVRTGYSGECVFPAARFESEFSPVKRQTFSEWHKANNAAEKIQKLRELITAGRAKQ
ncbi:DUF4222 domain-containing protein [Buttiauxella selenatireducens]|uniref:DUF4222 domain-containing protein n=1 Tax=Buttiauxella selenatireducens TaxID=3073902 RepID=A0ABY9S704_9ENTR|nr:DUF4222 domain-containing protein [Buttiauxella sp. R73]WMY72735.1 DUF4222 domain-containing protein [Buttiauxella sp. R73]